MHWNALGRRLLPFALVAALAILAVACTALPATPSPSPTSQPTAQSAVPTPVAPTASASGIQALIPTKAAAAAPPTVSAQQAHAWDQLFGRKMDEMLGDKDFKTCYDQATKSDSSSETTVLCWHMYLGFTEGKELAYVGFASAQAEPANAYDGPLPYGLTWQDTYETVQRKIGKPQKLTEGNMLSADYTHMVPYGLMIALDAKSPSDPTLGSAHMLYVMAVSPSVSAATETPAAVQPLATPRPTSTRATVVRTPTPIRAAPTAARPTPTPARQTSGRTWDKVLGMSMDTLEADAEYQSCLSFWLNNHTKGSNVHCWQMEILEDYGRNIVSGVVLLSGYNAAPLPYRLTWSDTYADVLRKLGEPSIVYDGGYSVGVSAQFNLSPYMVTVYLDNTNRSDPNLGSARITSIEIRV